ncbi:MAG TPA: copper chaperone PCu(A)C [Jatrophihabitantaceae bacterium]
MTRPPVAAFAAGIVAVLGLAGLIRGAVPQAAVSAGGAATDPIVISGAYVREPASPDVAAAYFTIYNTTGSDDGLLSVASGAGEDAVLHSDGDMTATPGILIIPAHSSVTLSPGKRHVMIEHLLGPLRPGQYVNLQLVFESAGPVNVSAPVIALTAPAPTAGAPR